MKDVLKKWLSNGVIYDPIGIQIYILENNAYAKHPIPLLNIQGESYIKNFLGLNDEDVLKFQDELGKFIAEAINEKITRSQ